MFLLLSVLLCPAMPGCLLLMTSSSAHAQSSTRYVATDGIDSGNCTDAESPCRTVQYAVDAADWGDVVKIASGIYADVHSRLAPPGYSGPAVITQVVYIRKSVTIRGGYASPGFTDPPDPESNPTTLDAEGEGRVLFVIGEITPTVEGLRITDGDATGLGECGGGIDAGGGVYIVTATALISGNEVFGNSVPDGDGGGLELRNSPSTLIGNVVYGNNAGFGAGLDLYKSAVTLIANTIVTNTSSDGGGGLTLSSSDATLDGNLIRANSAARGGGLQLWDSDARLVNNIIAENSTTGEGSGLLLQAASPLLLHNTIVHTLILRKSSVFLFDNANRGGF
jgi:hypothetical protein